MRPVLVARRLLSPLTVVLFASTGCSDDRSVDEAGVTTAPSGTEESSATGSTGDEESGREPALSGDIVYDLARDPGGDLYIGHSRFNADLTEIRRLSPDGEELWVHSHVSSAYLGGLEYAANGELIYVSSVNVNAALDPLGGRSRRSRPPPGPERRDHDGERLSRGRLCDVS